MSDTEQEPEATPTEGEEPAAEAAETAEVTEAEAPATAFAPAARAGRPRAGTVRHTWPASAAGERWPPASGAHSAAGRGCEQSVALAAGLLRHRWSTACPTPSGVSAASLRWPSPSASRDGLWTAMSFPSGIVKILHGEPDAAPAQQEGAAPGRPPARHTNGRHGQGR